MCNDRLVETIDMECPICGLSHSVQKRVRETQMLVKDEPVTYMQVYYLCPLNRDSDNSEFVTAEMMDENLLTARNEYRKAHGLLTSYEIKEVRSIYGLTQSEFSRILGVGEVTISRFETKATQTKVLDNAIREASDNRTGFLKKLYAKRDAFDTERFAEIETCIRKLIIDETPVISIQTVTLSQLTESIFSKYEVFSCHELIADFSEDYDLLPPQINVSVDKSKYYSQVQCEDSAFYNAAA